MLLMSASVLPAVLALTGCQYDQETPNDRTNPLAPDQEAHNVSASDDDEGPYVGGDVGVMSGGGGAPVSDSGRGGVAGGAPGYVYPGTTGTGSTGSGGPGMR